MDLQPLLDELRNSNQHPLASHLQNLPAEPQQRLARQLASFDYALVRELIRRAQQGQAAAAISEFEPAPVVPADRPKEELAASRDAGDAALRSGEVAAFVVAGGQGTRLRYDGPKGCYAIGPVSAKSLFQIHAEKILAASRRYGVRIPFYIMTSAANDSAVRAFFAEHNSFGLNPDDILFCVQRMLPAFDRQGHMLLDAPDHVFVNPDGHGGSLFALLQAGALADMNARGIRHLSYFQVDNPLVSVIDNLFIGEHIRRQSEFSSKVLRKRDPLEKLGVFGIIDGRISTIEYSDMPAELQHKTRPDGSLTYAFGSIAIHMIDVAFAQRMASADLPFHVALKSVPFIDAGGRRVQPDKPNAIKFERFIFDAIPHARNPLILETIREEEFAPVKNLSGEDSPDTARAAMIDQYHRWLRQAGIPAPPDLVVEISPLFAAGPDDLRRKAGQVRLRDGLYLG